MISSWVVHLILEAVGWLGVESEWIRLRLECQHHFVSNRKSWGSGHIRHGDEGWCHFEAFIWLPFESGSVSHHTFWGEKPLHVSSVSKDHLDVPAEDRGTRLPSAFQLCGRDTWWGWLNWTMYAESGTKSRMPLSDWGCWNVLFRLCSRYLWCSRSLIKMCAHYHWVMDW